jgi:hypothetical protein
MLALGVLVGAANADWPVWSGDIYDIYITNPVPVGDGSEDLESFIIRAVNTTGDTGYDPFGFDGVNYGYTGITSTTDSLHQHRYIFDSPAIITFPPPEWLRDGANWIDTHFLVYDDGDIVATEPLSENYLTNSSEMYYGYYGETHFGDTLTGTFSTTVTSGATWDIAQVVTSDRSSIQLDFFLSGTAGGEYVNVLIPGPATLSLLALGGLAVLRKRIK